uniref:Uncharacterized protein n=1 Tax=Timema tahoe TaxID=61484 RepID=A0A7R9FHW2_9NEOP|nr:unnamed protein product [Timema tahoe]
MRDLTVHSLAHLSLIATLLVVVVTMDERQQLVPLTLVSRVRERSVRSVPMSSRTNTTTSRSSFSGGTRTPDSLSDNESSLTRPLRKGSAPVRSTFTPGGSLPGSKAGSRPNSRPASRQGSKPPSRHGSTLSLDSTDEGTPSRIPVHQRRVTPASSTLPRSNASSSARKLTVPVNGTPGSRPRTPTGSGLISPASSVASRAGATGFASSGNVELPVWPVATQTKCQAHLISSSSLLVTERSGLESLTDVPVFATPGCAGHAYNLAHVHIQGILSLVDYGAPGLMWYRTGTIVRITGTGTVQGSQYLWVPLPQNLNFLLTLLLQGKTELSVLLTRTPSGSSTPIPPGTKVTRKPSGASDTSTGVSRKGSKSTTPTETRAPFRL